MFSTSCTCFKHTGQDTSGSWLSLGQWLGQWAYRNNHQMHLTVLLVFDSSSWSYDTGSEFCNRRHKVPPETLLHLALMGCQSALCIDLDPKSCLAYSTACLWSSRALTCFRSLWKPLIRISKLIYFTPNSSSEDWAQEFHLRRREVSPRRALRAALQGENQTQREQGKEEKTLTESGSQVLREGV